MTEVQLQMIYLPKTIASGRVDPVVHCMTSWSVAKQLVGQQTQPWHILQK